MRRIPECASGNDLLGLVYAIGDAGLTTLARRVRYRMLRHPASGIHSDQHRSLWREWMYEVEAGPSPWRHGFEEVIESFASPLLSALPLADACAMSIVASCEVDGDQAELRSKPAFSTYHLNQELKSRLIVAAWHDVEHGLCAAG